MSLYFFNWDHWGHWDRRDPIDPKPRGADLRCAHCGACISAGHEVLRGDQYFHTDCEPTEAQENP